MIYVLGQIFDWVLLIALLVGAVVVFEFVGRITREELAYNRQRKLARAERERNALVDAIAKRLSR